MKKNTIRWNIGRRWNLSENMEAWRWIGEGVGGGNMIWNITGWLVRRESNYGIHTEIGCKAIALSHSAQLFYVIWNIFPIVFVWESRLQHVNYSISNVSRSHRFTWTVKLFYFKIYICHASKYYYLIYTH